MSNVNVQLQDELQHSVSIKQTAKLTWYCEKLSLYWGNNDKWQDVIEELFLIRDEVVRRINNG